MCVSSMYYELDDKGLPGINGFKGGGVIIRFLPDI